MSALDVADALGVVPTLVHGEGEDGVVMLLEDGRVLKVTGCAGEAAVAAAISALPDGRRPDGVPRVDSVHACRPEDLGGRFARTFAILREDLADPPASSERRWRTALMLMDGGLRNGDGAMFVAGVDHWPGREMDALVANLYWYQKVMGVTLLDVQADNVGASATGGIGMRDLGRSIVPDRILGLLDDLPFLEDLPGLSPW